MTARLQKVLNALPAERKPADPNAVRQPERGLVCQRGVVSVGNKSWVRDYWVGLGKPDPLAYLEGDYTCPEVTHRYFTRAALVAALKDGSAWL